MYRMELHWHKFQLLEVRCSASMSTPTGKRIAPKPGIDYLDPVLSVDGLPMHELGRRIGTAKSDFLQLHKVWKHSSLHWTRKVRIYKALIESKLMYSLSCLCGSAAERRRLDGLQNSCLRRILGIASSFILRTSNAHVLPWASCGPCVAATQILLQRQLIPFGKALRFPYDHLTRSLSFITEVCKQPLASTLEG